ncbi:kinase-like domain-containing protein [Corynascus novoguineensis]|uniref:Kinase-like domain-containing protein n=1 Tax=Corynascus novoguineensis TaxID=1126955 RepID=A0AAN7HU15_9PEZI|nr:kinase-like domain-containing protein [Corynascus novoguineensis]
MPAPSPGSSAQPRRSALKTDGDTERASPFSAPVKAVQIAEPEPSSPAALDDAQVKKQFSAGVAAKRLSGRPPLSATPSRSSTFSQASTESGQSPVVVTPSASGEEAQSQPSHSHHRHRPDIVTERLLAQVADWLERERAKQTNKKSRRQNIRRKPQRNEISIPVPEPPRPRADSITSDSSEVSLDRLQRILDDNMAALGLNSLSQFMPRLGRRHRKRSSRNLARAASSDTEWLDDDVVVPSCDVFLDNSKTLAYSGGKAGADDITSISSRKEEKERQHWLNFKNEIIRLAHTLRLKGWRRVPLDSGDTISVERLSGALTNAVYVVSPPPESLLPREPGKKQPGKVLLRVYGPQVEHLIDRENELGVLKRLARKKIGPRLLGTFLNGRFEQYLNATALTPGSMRDADTSRQIAKRMRELHDGVELLDEERDQGPAVWKNWDKWLGQVEKTVLFLDKQILSQSQNLSGNMSKSRGFICGVQWPVFKALVEKYRRYLEAHYGDTKTIRNKLVFAHNDTQYGNILRVRPDDQKSPLLQPANEHKQLVVIDFEYAAANLPGLEFANHFTEWAYNYHDPVHPYACDTSRYPSPEQQRRFVKAYVDHRPQFTYAADSSSSPAAPTSTSSSPPPPANGLHAVPSTSSIVEFMLDARVPPGGWREEERRREEEAEARVRALLEETRLWRTANSAQWVAWGIVQAKVPGLDTGDEKKMPVEEEDEKDGRNGDGATAANGEGKSEEDDGGEEEEFDYLAYAQERAFFFLGDCVLLGLVKPEELGEDVRAKLKLVEY